MKGSHTSIVIVAMVLGAALGLGSYTFGYARGWAYLTDDPRACANCHVMNEQYDAYLRTVDQQRTRYGGSEAMPRSPTEADPRSFVAHSRLEEDPRLKTMWAGYAFATDFRKKRGHAYMLEDQTFTERVQHFKQPGMREGAQKISDHHVRSPLLNINRACQTCHKWSEDELRGRVETVQQRTVDLRNRAMDALMALIADLKAAKAAGATGPAVTAALEFQRHGQFYVDFVESENSNGFHAPQEAARILGEAIDYLRQGQLALRPAHVAAPPSPGRP